jgi:hypothetical protein
MDHPYLTLVRADLCATAVVEENRHQRERKLPLIQMAPQSRLQLNCHQVSAYSGDGERSFRRKVNACSGERER